MGYDNVIIFGAGASFNAGIPLLNNFVDTMWGYSVRGRTNKGDEISKADRELFARADGIRIGLERYNSRANFNLRNLEDVLSLLSFEALSGGEALEKYQTWVRAVARVVELSTFFQYQAVKADPNYSMTVYHKFWDALLGANSRVTTPALITFNYDLVLERTLWDYFHGATNIQNNFRPKNKSYKINYSLKPYDFLISTDSHRYILPSGQGTNVITPGYKPLIYHNATAEIEIPYLKLHGSLNWSSQGLPPKNQPISDGLTPINLPTQAVDSPLILPPVFNKMNMNDLDSVWQKALEVLREAKHIILVGYSLPKTDIYMQYFVKSAVGPNSNLQKIIVFDPVLFGEGDANEEMRKRFKECFSPQFQNQIIFKPAYTPTVGDESGKFTHFVHSLIASPNELFFTP